MKTYQKNRLSQYVVAALTVGMFSLAPLAYALPVQDMTHANTTGTAINTATANQMGITGTAANNVMNWQTFSIASGDAGFVGTAELRYKTGVPGLVLSTYLDGGHVQLSKDGGSGNATLKGYGFAVSYTRPDDWFARLDYARRIGGDSNMSDSAQDKGRLWFLVGKVF